LHFFIAWIAAQRAATLLLLDIVMFFIKVRVGFSAVWAAESEDCGVIVTDVKVQVGLLQAVHVLSPVGFARIAC
jgi:hypothetical protein